MVFLTSGATSPLVPVQFPRYYFMTCFGDNAQAAAGAEYAFGTLEARTAWLLFDDTIDYTVLLARYFASATPSLGATSSGRTHTPATRSICRIRSRASRRCRRCPTCCTSHPGRTTSAG
jgi:ABC-type branched-subunit amino acid transport system substrate-binding protein